MSIPSPHTGVGRRELDFGPGFYVTNLREQAERWARRVCVIRAVDTPMLSAYEFDEALLRFAKPTHQMCISRQSIVDSCLRFIATEPVLEKGGQQ